MAVHSNSGSVAWDPAQHSVQDNRFKISEYQTAISNIRNSNTSPHTVVSFFRSIANPLGKQIAVLEGEISNITRYMESSGQNKAHLFSESILGRLPAPSAHESEGVKAIRHLAEQKLPLKSFQEAFNAIVDKAVRPLAEDFKKAADTVFSVVLEKRVDAETSQAFTAIRDTVNQKAKQLLPEVVFQPFTGL
ncbi:hypothetical protein COB21_06110 [Candidatus Aerophobetes bacterium]|uniref:Uncharacterized protein n=1 Tax=Aerophobetes bacterium TaxID=2030807 RepID=A0A2A4WXH7_UNCAE|nr:MAG: hypothetical protein COB21_06110 [Candidatus Aerophobetes bacterium]